MRIVGLDLSLASTGVAVIDEGAEVSVDRIATKPSGDNLWHRAHRLQRITTIVLDTVHTGGTPDLVVIEGPSHGQARQGGQHDRAGLWWLIVEALVAVEEIPVAEVPPATLKRYACGKGNAGKDEVLAAVVRRYPTVEVVGNDTADALTLAAMGADHLGHPIAAMPATHRAALDKVAWPELTP